MLKLQPAVKFIKIFLCGIEKLLMSSNNMLRSKDVFLISSFSKNNQMIGVLENLSSEHYELKLCIIDSQECKKHIMHWTYGFKVR